jgi:hypothetical protein
MIKLILKSAALGLLLSSSQASFAGASNYWNKFNGTAAPSKMESTLNASSYALFTLDQVAMKQFLLGVGSTYETGASITLPTPDRKYRTFRIWKTPMMEAALAKNNPDILTFTAEAEDDAYITAKIDYTLFGFSAMVYDGKETYFIDPYSRAADGYYAAFYKKDYKSTLPSVGCMVGTSQAPGLNYGHEITNEDNMPSINDAQKSHGNLKRSYRLALSCTGEYAMAVAGSNPTKAQVLSVMVTTINRVNGYYEKELAVHFDLIATNEDIIYTNPTTDPYNCNTNLDCLIGEAETNISGVIQPSNYDIGHILSTAGGGLAQLQSTCALDGKARAASSSGSATDIHVILHEMGHQFGSNHTFNSNTGGCLNNGNEGTGYEPGSGVTIMSYAGLCAADNVGQPADDYFHVSSLNEISSFLLGHGGSCANTSNGIPVVGLPNFVDSFKIPKNTPFELEGPVATSSQPTAVIRYNWEQWDLGNFGDPEANSAATNTAPLFRSWDPSSKRTVAYPTYANIMAGTYTSPGQRLTTAERTIRFKYIARAVFQGWGTFNFIDTVVRVKTDGNSSTFRVTSQASDETWNPTETKRISWDVGDSNNDSVNCKWVNIYLSTDNGDNFTYLLAANIPNNGAYDVVVPEGYSPNCRIKIKSAGNIFFDVNKGNILLNGDPASISNVKSLNGISIYPNPATNHVTVVDKTHNRNLKVAMYNALGQTVWSGSLNGHMTIDVASFAKGNYWIQTIDTDNGQRGTQQIVLQ